jgi:hypothetical protein
MASALASTLALERAPCLELSGCSLLRVKQTLSSAALLVQVSVRSRLGSRESDFPFPSVRD